MSVLVAYASKHGSTQEVAEAIAATIQGHDVDVDIRPAPTVGRSIGDPELVVLGAPLYSGRWHRDAHRFLKRHRSELMSVPVAVFGMGPRDPSEEAWQRARGQLDRALAKRGWLRPVAVAVFGGVDPTEREGKPKRDLRNWDEIRAWALQVAGLA